MHFALRPHPFMYMYFRSTLLLGSVYNILGGRSVYISDIYSSYTPGVFYTHFYNHAHRLRLEKLL